MSTQIKDLDAGRTVEVEVRGTSVFLAGKVAGEDFCYEFDIGLIWHGIKRELGPHLTAADGFCPFTVKTRDVVAACPADIAA